MCWSYYYLTKESMPKKPTTVERRYEMMFIIQPSATENTRTKLLDEVRGFIKEAGGTIFHEDDWGLRDLAYTIKKVDTGYYNIFYFNDTDTTKMQELDENMRLVPNMLRHLITSIPLDHELVQYNEDEADAADKK
ncbi:30S ribosomal protein S6 [Candidatus Peregrinibacteria bacterium CG11_big_fil_rev_8_21_14_0_20_41_10]|nr:MAG: 30S ribosomal protein S6 [Candidatus Peregrinibacteria bacterium CG11_big_fil_rev_8_21_14_0_20_41_10]PIZ74827.1 MAG: 30S ribosomal protein S6 [Candidatus Peregrinibacteria bacterium CG_4_10_14_0_2_um_filter_41_8]PJC38189.1 MAG: 30S ribosomal protein S6 [Candidatus Peregrinibacteria bacterium CG_4_9_14_0_2_um_filter_41_14]